MNSAIGFKGDANFLLPQVQIVHRGLKCSRPKILGWVTTKWACEMERWKMRPKAYAVRRFFFRCTLPGKAYAVRSQKAAY
ncbi:unnamed protein product [Cuscuta campestris]|uniref:Uncharacterized protein n=1 Tax=Cuscuta campestris TaxID=132261 RepID=A0A484LXC2_9ASTE|nr:unnamed protein product [Cuscuta campestris]